MSTSRMSFAAAWLMFLAVGPVAQAGEAQWVEGITEPISDVTLSASVPGIVSAWNFKEGDLVASNDVIIELDSELEELEVERREAAMENAQSELKSLQTLAAQSSISVKKEDLEKAETDFRIAKTEHAMAVEQLRRRRIASPCPGYIVEITRDVGEACQAYQPLIRVVDTHECYFVCNIEARQAFGLKLGQTMKLEIETPESATPVEGKITYLGPVVDPASGLRKVKVLFDNSDEKIRPGIAGRMQIPSA